MNIDELTIREAKKLASIFSNGGQDHSLLVGENVFIRTVTLYFTGRIKSVTASDIVLEDAAWIASTGRWADALKTGKLDEVEPYPSRVIVSRAGIIDVTPWTHDLPREQK